MKRRAEGSITVYLCLILLVMLSLIFAGISSARSAARRVTLAAGTEEGLFSAFSQYDRTLSDTWGLYFLDASLGTDEPQYGKILKSIREDADYIIDPRRENPVGKNLLGLETCPEQCALTGYVLATDCGGQPFARQACRQMTQQLGTAALEALKKRLSEESVKAGEGKERRGRINSGTAGELYDESHPEGNTVEPDSEIEVTNPGESVTSAKKRGILALTVPSSKHVSAGKADIRDFVSHRQLESGMAMVPTGYSGDAEKILLLEYLMQNFSSFTDEEDGDGLRYQVEYAIGGKDTDEENLRAVVRKLLWFREGFNMIHIMSSPGKRAQCEATADLVAAAILLPAAAPAIAWTIELAWAYAESVMDVQELLDGGRIALFKDDASWQVSYSGLGSFLSGSERHSSSNGLDYEEYLRLLLIAQSAQALTLSLMDLTEYVIREEERRESFRLDHCVEVLRVQMAARAGTTVYTCERSYGYDMEY